MKRDPNALTIRDYILITITALVAIALALDATKVWSQDFDPLDYPHIPVYRSGPHTVNPLNHDGMLRLGRSLEAGPRVTYYRPNYRKPHNPNRGTATRFDITRRTTWRRDLYLARRARQQLGQVRVGQ